MRGRRLARRSPNGTAAAPHLNGTIPSKQRAALLSFDSLMGNAGGVVIQPVLGRTADISGYGVSLLFGAIIQLASVPFLHFSRRQNPPADTAPGNPSNTPKT